jgi:hypothetical protein
MDPALKEGSCAVTGVDRGEQDSFGPPSRPTMTVNRYKINVDVREVNPFGSASRRGSR